MRRRLIVALLALGVVALWAVGPPTRAGDVPGEECLDCHDQEFIPEFYRTPHGRIAEGDWYGAANACGSCHGDVERHMEEGDPEIVRTYPGADPSADSELCLSCHTAASHMGAWPASEHALAGLSCLDCHPIHGDGELHMADRDQELGIRAELVPVRTCYYCHEDVQAQFRMPSHHPVAEGKMDCASCHDVHGANPGLLKTALRTNDLCYDCHAAKQGPYIFQHDPVEEDCSICHQPHGGVADNLLAQTEPFLCLQCHEVHFHAGLESPEGEITYKGNVRQNPHGHESLKHAFLTKCTQCHSAVHGSDLPSQSVTSQGESLLR